MGAGIIIIFVLFMVAMAIYATLYNGLVHAKQKVKEAWSGMDVQLKRRYDLIPSLVKTVKGYAEHEKSVLENVTKARAEAINVPAGKIGAQAGAENMLSSALKSIFAVAENYPNLKASANFLNLQTQLEETEDQISASRRIYNGNVTSMNTKVQSFPSNIVAGVHHFTESEFFELDAKEKLKVQEAPKIEF